jgi:hypothetical protein
MRSAPPVSVQCTGGRLWRVVQTLLPALAAAALVAWVAGHAAWPVDKTSWAALLFSLCVASLAWRVAVPTQTTLAWRHPAWTANGSVVQVTVTMDLATWVLLRLKPNVAGEVTPRWLAVSASDAGPAWHGLRVALYALSDSAAVDKAAPTGPHV